MYEVPISYHNRLLTGECPTPYIIIEAILGNHLYAEKDLTKASIIAPLGRSARVISFGDFERTIQPRNQDVLTAYIRRQKQRLTVTLSNADNYFSQVLPKDPFLGRTLAYWIGFLPPYGISHIKLFSGTITEISIEDNGTMTLQAEEQ